MSRKLHAQPKTQPLITVFSNCVQRVSFVLALSFHFILLCFVCLFFVLRKQNQFKSVFFLSFILWISCFACLSLTAILIPAYFCITTFSLQRSISLPVENAIFDGKICTHLYEFNPFECRCDKNRIYWRSILDWKLNTRKRKKNEQTRNLSNQQQKQSAWLIHQKEREIHFISTDGWTSRATASLPYLLSADFLFQFVGRVGFCTSNCFKKYIASICQFSLGTRNWIV